MPALNGYEILRYHAAFGRFQYTCRHPLLRYYLRINLYVLDSATVAVGCPVLCHTEQ